MTRAHLPMMTTSEVARLAHVPPQSINSAVARTGSWRDITPTRQANGHYLWPTEEVHSALGLVPDWHVMTPGERAWCQFLEHEAVPLKAQNFSLGRTLLSYEVDKGRDADCYANELTLFREFAEAFCARADAAIPKMSRGRTTLSKAALALVAARTQECVTPDWDSMMSDARVEKRRRVLSALEFAGEIATTECQDYLGVENPALSVFDLRILGWPIAEVRRRIRDKDGVYHNQLVYVLTGECLHEE